MTPLSDDDLVDLFGTSKPTREMIESNDELFEALERSQGVFIVAYQEDKPSGALTFTAPTRSCSRRQST